MNFNTISINLLTPGAYIEFSNAQAFPNSLAPLPHRALLLGQRLAGAAVLADVPTLISYLGQGAKCFGRGSMLAQMCDAFINANPNCELWAVSLDDLTAGVKATSTLTITGPATAAGTLALYIGGTYVPVGVSLADTPAIIAANIAAAIAALPDLPVTAASAAGVVTLTANHKGIAGNTIDVRLNYNQGDATPAGVAAAIVAFSGGTGNPDITPAIAALGSQQYTSIVTAFLDTANLGVLETELNTRWDGMHTDDGIAFCAPSGSFSTVGTFGDGQNCQFLVARGNQNSPTLPWAMAAIDAAVDESEDDPGMPRQTLPMPGLLPPAIVDRLDQSHRNQLLFRGIATFRVGAGGICQIERSVTTYKTNGSGVPDASYRDIEVMRLLSAIRYTTRVRILTKYPRCKLGQDGSIGPNVVTPKAIRGEMIALYQDWMTSGWVEGGAALQQFITDLVVDISSTDPNRVEILLPPNLINQLRVVAAQVQFRA